MNDRDTLHRTVLPIPDQARTGLITYDGQGSRDEVSADPTAAAADGRAQRPHHPDRRCGFRLVERVRRPVPDAERGTSRGERPEIPPLPHDRAVLADPAGAVDRAQSPSVGMGGITEIASGSPGYNSVLPNTAAPLAKTLKLNGYATAQFGKCHEVPVWETSPAGPSTPGRPAAAASSTSTASSAARRTSGIRRCTRARRRSR